MIQLIMAITNRICEFHTPLGFTFAKNKHYQEAAGAQSQNTHNLASMHMEAGCRRQRAAVGIEPIQMRRSDHFLGRSWQVREQCVATSRIEFAENVIDKNDRRGLPPFLKQAGLG
ncbi:MAG: hypothetical protein R3F19_07780 [Verrucomicrobiales bacterium]